MTTREELDKRWPPKRKYRTPDHAKGIDATEFVARYGELKARVEAPEGDKNACATDTSRN